MRFRLLLYIVLSIVSIEGIAQSNQDFGIWFGSSFTKKINDQFKFEGKVSLRTDDNSGHVRQVFYQLGLQTKVVDNLKTGIAYRNKFAFDYTGSKIVNRLIWDVIYKVKLSGVSFQIRNRLQKSFTLDQKNNTYDRVKLKATLKLQDGLKAFLFNEMFFKLNRNKGVPYNVNRFGLGMSYKIDDTKGVSLAYLRQNDLVGYAPLKMNVISLKFDIKF